MRAGFFKRYFTVVGIILVVIVGLGVWLKPSASELRESVETSLADEARERVAAGDASVVPVSYAAHDWLIAAGQTAKVGDRTYYCVGGFSVTICDFRK